MQSLLSDVLITIGLFLPAYFANMAPVLLVRTKLFKWYGKPIDAGKKLWGERLFGDGKTYYGLIVAMIGGAVGALAFLLIAFLTPCIKNNDSCHDLFSLLIDALSESMLLMFFALVILVFQGMLIGLGAILGDLIESFIKRRLKIKSGKSWPVFDQVDFIIGAWFVMIIIYPLIDWKYFFIALIITPLLHLLSNVIAYKLKLKKVWW